MFSDSYIARLNFMHTDHTALSIEPPFTKPSSYASVHDCLSQKPGSKSNAATDTVQCRNRKQEIF